MLKDRFNSFKYAFKGITSLFQSEANAKIHLLAAILVVIAGIYFQISLVEWMICTLCIVAVFSAEAFNTAIEQLTDLVSPEHNEKAGRIKDLSAAAVLLIAIGAAIAGLIIFLPEILESIRS